ncbi:MAG TPA: 50S ribosomal protein L11 methyltransferase [Flavisolibacter sp.]|nr:50S ribosomal protein L11 methyltransferase [Flavisolibacter sp.]
MTNHTQLSIEALEEQQEILISQLEELGATGFEQTDTHLLAYFEEDAFPSYDVQALLEGYNFQLNTLQQQNWNAVWESNFQPVIVDDFCAVRAHFHEPIQGVKHEILITPKMSFGTGHHATTYMMMQQMRDINFDGKRVFDFGTGTGVLAILAEKLGAVSVYAIDNDEWSITNAQENLKKNNCQHIDVEFASNIPTDMSFDVILANINRNVILQYFSFLKQAVKEKGLILFSGLLETDRDIIVETAQRHGLELIKHNERNKWISLLFVNEK